MTELEASVALNMLPNMGPVRLRKLLERFETPERILLGRESEFRAVDGINAELASVIANWEKHADLKAELDLVKQFGANVITQTSPVYPRELKTIHNPPIILYVWGELTERDQRAIGVVGSRKTSHYGLDCAKKLSYQLAYAGLTIVSGLARGIDTAAHQGALAAGARTVAVIGSGLMDLYPPENKALAEKIAASGAVVSEYPMRFPPSVQTFPYRNRIVAGWGSGVLVVEAGLSSGALITANQALEHGRLVYAIPGPIDRPTSAGSNRLIQQGAKLVTCAGDVLDDLNLLFHETPAARASAPPAPLLPDEASILAALEEGDLSLDEVITASKLPAAKASSCLLAMEMKRLVKQLPGQRFAKRA